MANFALSTCESFVGFLLLLASYVALNMAQSSPPADLESVMDWRAYWKLKLPTVQPPLALQELAPRLTPAEIQAFLDCVATRPYGQCLCTYVNSVCTEVTSHRSNPQPRVCMPDFSYQYLRRCEEDRHAETVGSKMFFRRMDLSVGKVVSLPSLKNDLYNRAFLPRQLADKLPFTSKKLSESLHQLQLKRYSPKAKGMAETLEFCTSEPATGEFRQCHASIESMVDFEVSHLGKKVMILSWDAMISDRGNTTKIDHIKETPAKIEEKIVTCHDVIYPYLVFGCHSTSFTSLLLVTLEGIHGHALAVCHHNTTHWNPQHVAFRVLGVKPGDGHEVCHWIPRHHFAWASLP